MVWIVRMQGSTVGGGGVPHRDRRILGYVRSPGLTSKANVPIIHPSIFLAL